MFNKIFQTKFLLSPKKIEPLLFEINRAAVLQYAFQYSLCPFNTAVLHKVALPINIETRSEPRNMQMQSDGFPSCASNDSLRRIDRRIDALSGEPNLIASFE